MSNITSTTTTTTLKQVAGPADESGADFRHMIKMIYLLRRNGRRRGDLGRYGNMDREQFGDTIENIADDTTLSLNFSITVHKENYRQRVTIVMMLTICYDGFTTLVQTLGRSYTIVDGSGGNHDSVSDHNQTILITEDKVIVGARYAGPIQDGRFMYLTETEFMSASGSIPKYDKQCDLFLRIEHESL